MNAEPPVPDRDVTANLDGSRTRPVFASLWDAGRALLECGDLDAAAMKLDAARQAAPPQLQSVLLYDLGVALERITESDPARARDCIGTFRASIHAALAVLSGSGDTSLLMMAMDAYARAVGQWGEAEDLEEAAGTVHRLESFAPALDLAVRLRLPWAQLASGWMRLSTDAGSPDTVPRATKIFDEVFPARRLDPDDGVARKLALNACTAWIRSSTSQGQLIRNLDIALGYERWAATDVSATLRANVVNCLLGLSNELDARAMAGARQHVLRTWFPDELRAMQSEDLRGDVAEIEETCASPDARLLIGEEIVFLHAIGREVFADMPQTAGPIEMDIAVKEFKRTAASKYGAMSELLPFAWKLIESAGRELIEDEAPDEMERRLSRELAEIKRVRSAHVPPTSAEVKGQSIIEACAESAALFIDPDGINVALDRLGSLLERLVEAEPWDESWRSAGLLSLAYINLASATPVVSSPLPAHLFSTVEAISQLVELIPDARRSGDVVLMLVQETAVKWMHRDVAALMIPLVQRALERSEQALRATVDAELARVGSECARMLSWLFGRVDEVEQAAEVIGLTSWIHDLAASTNTELAADILEDVGRLTLGAAPRDESTISTQSRDLEMLLRRRRALVSQQDPSSSRLKLNAALIVIAIAGGATIPESTPTEILESVVELAVLFARDGSSAVSLRMQTMLALASDSFAADFSVAQVRADWCRAAVYLGSGSSEPDVVRLRVRAAIDLVRLGSFDPSDARLEFTVAVDALERGDLGGCISVLGVLGRRTSDSPDFGMRERRAFIALGVRSIQRLHAVEEIDGPVLLTLVEAIAEHFRLGAFSVRDAYAWHALVQQLLGTYPEWQLYPTHAEDARFNRLQLEVTLGVRTSDWELTSGALADLVHCTMAFDPPDQPWSAVAAALAILPRDLPPEGDGLVEEVLSLLENANAAQQTMTHPAIEVAIAKHRGIGRDADGPSVDWVAPPEFAAAQRAARAEVLLDAGRWEEALHEARLIAGELSWGIIRSANFEEAVENDYLGSLTARIARLAAKDGAFLEAFGALELGRGQVLLALQRARWEWSQPKVSTETSRAIEASMRSLEHVVELVGLPSWGLSGDGVDAVDPATPHRIVEELVADPGIASGILGEDWSTLFEDPSPSGILEASGTYGVLTVFWVVEGVLHGLAVVDGVIATSFLSSHSLLEADLEPLVQELTSFAHGLLHAIETDEAFETRPRRIAVVPAREAWRLAPLLSSVWAAEMDCANSSIAPRSVSVLPSVRFLDPAPSGGAPGGRVLYLTDPTSSLLGPALEHAALGQLPGLDVVNVQGFADLDDRLSRVGSVDVVIISAHGISAGSAGAATGAVFGRRIWGLPDVVRLAKNLGPSSLVLASCGLGAVDDSRREADAISLAGSALVAGISTVIAPTGAVDDLPAALLVVQMMRKYQESRDMPEAFNAAMRNLAELTESDLLSQVRDLASEATFPFPHAVADREIDRQIQLMAPLQLWRAQPYICLSR